jgi:hypothetical protein
MNFRSWRLKIIPVVGAYILLAQLLFANRHRLLLGYRVFWLGALILLYFWWRMDRADELHLAIQEEKSRGDPLHLYDVSTGLRANPRERMGICFSLAMMGLSLLIEAFAVSDIGLIFWGTSFCLVAASVFSLT